MTKRRNLLITGSVVLALAAGGIGISQAIGDDPGRDVSGPRAEQAGRAALHAVGADTVERVQRSQERGAAWDVEVFKRENRLDTWPGSESRGRQIEVLLDARLDFVQASVTGYK
jgi:hypothetical protein